MTLTNHIDRPGLARLSSNTPRPTPAFLAPTQTWA